MQASRCYQSTLIMLLAVPLLTPAPAFALAADAQQATTAATLVITDMAQKALAYAAVLAAAGTVSMAFVELIKAVLDLRRLFQQHMLNRWLGPQLTDVRPELLYLAIGDEVHANVLCGQPLEKMMGQLQAASRIALDYPEKFPKLFSFLTSTDFEASPTAGAAATVAPTDRAAWSDHAKVVRDVSMRLRSTAGTEAKTSAEDAGTASDAAQARARLASLVGRKLDGFQLRTQFWWERGNQALSLILSVVILEIAVSEAVGRDHLLEGLFLGVMGGLLAPFAKDFSQALASFAK